MGQWLTKVTRSIFGEIDQVSKCGLTNGQGPVAHRSERSTFAEIDQVSISRAAGGHGPVVHKSDAANFKRN